MEKKDWSEIPSLEGLEMDWDYKAENDLGQRAHARLNRDDLTRILDTPNILVKIATVAGNATGFLHDISEGGLAITLPTRLEPDQPLKVGLLLGKEKIISRARVRHVQPGDRQYTTGLMFVGIDREAKRFLASMYASKVFKQNH